MIEIDFAGLIEILVPDMSKVVSCPFQRNVDVLPELVAPHGFMGKDIVELLRHIIRRLIMR